MVDGFLNPGIERHVAFRGLDLGVTNQVGGKAKGEVPFLGLHIFKCTTREYVEQNSTAKLLKGFTPKDPLYENQPNGDNLSPIIYGYPTAHSRSAYPPRAGVSAHARHRHRRAYPTGHAWRVRGETRIAVPCASPPGAARLDCWRMGRFSKQPARPLLHAHPHRPRPAHPRKAQLVSDDLGHELDVGIRNVGAPDVPTNFPPLGQHV